MAWEQYGNAVWMCKDETRIAKVQMELNLMRGVENKKQEFLRYTGNKRQANENVPPLTIEKGEQASSDMKKAEVYSTRSLLRSSLPVKLPTSSKSIIYLKNFRFTLNFNIKGCVVLMYFLCCTVVCYQIKTDFLMEYSSNTPKLPSTFIMGHVLTEFVTSTNQIQVKSLSVTA